ncbi:MAG: CAP domain-containing protein [Pseudomonadota bacterium]
MSDELMASLINAARAREALGFVNYDARLDRAAQLHAADLAARRVLSHGSGPDNTLTVGDRVTAQGYTWSLVAENVAFNQRDTEDVFQAWMTSDGHRANILAPGITHFGFGGASNDMGPYWAQVFAAPL